MNNSESMAFWLVSVIQGFQALFSGQLFLGGHSFL